MTSMDQKIHGLLKRVENLPRSSDDKIVAETLGKQWLKRGFLTESQLTLLRPLFIRYEVAQ